MLRILIEELKPETLWKHDTLEYVIKTPKNCWTTLLRVKLLKLLGCNQKHEEYVKYKILDLNEEFFAGVRKLINDHERSTGEFPTHIFLNFSNFTELQCSDYFRYQFIIPKSPELKRQDFGNLYGMKIILHRAITHAFCLNLK